MTSKTSFFDAVIFRRDIRRMAPLWAVYLLIGVLAMPVSIYETYRLAAYDSLAYDVARHIVTGSTFMFTVGNFVYGAIAAWIAYFYLFRPRSANFYSALPVRRETLFLTHFLSGLAVNVIPNLIVAVSTMLVTASIGAPQAAAVAEGLAANTLSYLCFYGFAVLCCCVIGNAVAMPFLYIVLNFAVPVLEAAVRSVISSFVYGMPVSGILLDFCSPLYKMLNSQLYSHYELIGDVRQWHITGWGYLGIIAVGGLLLTVIAFFLHRSREMERCGDVVAVRWLRPVFLYAFTFCCSLIIGIVLYTIITNGKSGGNFPIILLSMLIGAVIGFFGAKMMLGKTLRVFSSGWKQLGVCCVIIVALMCLAQFDAFGYERFVPELSQIRSVELSDVSGETQYAVEDAETVRLTTQLHERFIAEKKQIEAGLAEQYENNYDRSGWWSSVELTYHLTNGKKVTRQYHVFRNNTWTSDDETLFCQLQTLMNSQPVTLARTTPGFAFTAQDVITCEITGQGLELNEYGDGMYRDITIGNEEAYRLFTECILPDLKDSQLGNNYNYYYLHDTDWEKPVSNVYIRFEVGKDGQRFFYCYQLTPDAQRCIEFVRSKNFRVS